MDGGNKPFAEETSVSPVSFFSAVRQMSFVFIRAKLQPASLGLLFLALFILIGYGVGPLYAHLPVEVRIYATGAWLAAFVVTSAVLGPSVIVLLYRARASAAWMVPVLSLTFSALLHFSGLMSLATGIAFGWPDQIRLIVLDGMFAMAVSWPRFLVGHQSMLQALERVHQAPADHAPGSAAVADAIWHLSRVVFDGMKTPAFWGFMVLAAIIQVGYGVGFYYSAFAIETRFVIGVLWFASAASIALLIMPATIIAVFLSGFSISWSIPVVAIVFGFFFHLMGIPMWVAPAGWVGGGVVANALLDAAICMMIFYPFFVLQRDDYRHVLRSFFPGLTQVSPRDDPSGSEFSLHSVEKETTSSGARGESGFAVFLEACVSRWSEWIKTMASPKFLFLIIGVVTCTFSMNFIPTIPNDMTDRMFLATQWIVLGIPVFLFVLVPSEVLVARHKPDLDIIFPTIAASLTTSAVMIAVHDVVLPYLVGSEPYQLPQDFTVMEGFAIAAFVCTLVARFLIGYGPELLSSANQATWRASTLDGTPTGSKNSPLQSLMPRFKRGVVLELTAMNKSTEIRTEHGLHIVRLPLKSAVLEMPAGEGLLVHRSHWISFAEMDDLFYESGNPRLRLGNGEIRPVSRAAASEIRDFLSS